MSFQIKIFLKKKKEKENKRIFAEHDATAATHYPLNRLCTTATMSAASPVGSEGEIGGSAVLIDGAIHGADLDGFHKEQPEQESDNFEDAVLNALLGNANSSPPPETLSEEKPMENASEFLRLWDSDMRSYLAR